MFLLSVLFIYLPVRRNPRAFIKNLTIKMQAIYIVFIIFEFKLYLVIIPIIGTTLGKVVLLRLINMKTAIYLIFILRYSWV